MTTAISAIRLWTMHNRVEWPDQRTNWHSSASDLDWCRWELALQGVESLCL